MQHYLNLKKVESIIKKHGEATMRRLSAFLAILLALVWASTLNADIYVWTDEDGVKNFTNFSPPEGAEIFIKDSGISQKTAEDTPPRTFETQPPKPDATGEVSRLREELEAVKKLLAENLEASKAVEEDPYPDRRVPVEDAYDASDDTNTAAEPQRSYTTVHKYYYPYYGYGAYGLFQDRHSGKRFRHKRHFHRKSRYSGHKKYYSHRRGHGKQHRAKLKKQKHDIHHSVKHRIGSKRRHAQGWNRNGRFRSGSRIHYRHRR
jgi:hypothetical protein